MTDKKRVPFKALGSELADFGELVVGQDGTMLYSSHDVQTGKVVTVVLYVTKEQRTKLLTELAKLVDKHDEYHERMVKRTINHTPADMDFASILNEFKQTGKPH